MPLSHDQINPISSFQPNYSIPFYSFSGLTTQSDRPPIQVGFFVISQGNLNRPDDIQYPDTAGNTLQWQMMPSTVKPEWYWLLWQLSWHNQLQGVAQAGIRDTGHNYVRRAWATEVNYGNHHRRWQLNTNHPTSFHFSHLHNWGVKGLRFGLGRCSHSS